MNAPISSPKRPLRRAASIAEPPEELSASEGKARVMIVDDSLTVRTILKRMVEGEEGMRVVATASSAERAIAQLKSMTVDVILLDLEMPGMGGLEALPSLLETSGDAEVLVVSSLTDDGAEATMAALSMGAADTMLKPRPGGFTDEYRKLLLDKIRALGSAEESVPKSETEPAKPSKSIRLKSLVHPEIVAIGASTGGIHALNRLLRNMHAEFDVPILITQHLPASFIPVFARQIETVSGRETIVADEGTRIRPGTIAIATGKGHMVLRRIGDDLIARVSTEPVQSGCLPSVDPMLSSLASTCEDRVLAILLSGMGRDGFEGAQAVAKAGGTIFAQDADTSAVWGMPGAVAKAGLASLVAPPEELSNAVIELSNPALHS